jgi:hypothetical protein
VTKNLVFQEKHFRTFSIFCHPALCGPQNRWARYDKLGFCERWVGETVGENCFLILSAFIYSYAKILVVDMKSIFS